MAGFQTNNTQFFLRANLYSRQLKELLLDELNGLKFVRIISDFPDGQTFNIPSLGEAEQSTFTEGQAIKYNSMATGNFTFSFDQYVYSANAISEKMMRDSFWSSDIVSSFVPKQHRVLMEGLETRIFAQANNGQIAANLNTINNASHRWVGSGLGPSSVPVLSLTDFSKARYALTKANVPLTSLVAVVDPSVAYTLETQTNAVNLLTPSPRYQSIVNDGLVTGFKFRYHFMDFDIYVSNYLPPIASETINGVACTGGVANFFFSAAPGDTLPWIGGFRQPPTVYSEFNKDLQQHEFLTIAEYGIKLYRPENMIGILTSTSAVPA